MNLRTILRTTSFVVKKKVLVHNLRIANVLRGPCRKNAGKLVVLLPAHNDLLGTNPRARHQLNDPIRSSPLLSRPSRARFQPTIVSTVMKKADLPLANVAVTEFCRSSSSYLFLYLHGGVSH